MPQGRRKVPFSGKAKKSQLQAKKQQKGNSSVLVSRSRNRDEEDECEREVLKINQQPKVNGNRSKSNRYALQFFCETADEVQRQKETAYLSLSVIPKSQLEVAIEDYFTPELDFPKRPPWNVEMSREELEAREHRYFTEYVSSLQKRFDRDLCYFELNLETWRQLWRVIEMSDIMLVILDIRFPALMFPPSLYQYVTEVLKKDMILVLNKVDLAPASLVVAWKDYFKKKFPNLHVLMFTSYPSYNLRGNQNNKAGLKVRRRKGKLRMAAEGAQKLLQACKDIVQDKVDLSSWHTKILEEMEVEYENDEIEIEETVEVKKVDTSYIEHEKYRNGILTIGCVGQPNVGKSSLMNAIMGKKVVSVSRTPGHTKHFQTIYLTSNVRLCDCPGLVFPSRVPKTLQILMGSFPIAQVREPFSTVRFLAERLDLPHLLSLQHPEGDDEWSAMDVCEGWAQKRGFYTARAARLDSYRAANHLLRMALEGKICLCLSSPGYTDKIDYWNNHEEVTLVRWIQARSLEKEGHCGIMKVEIDSSDEDGTGVPRESDVQHMQGDKGQSEASEDDIKISSNKFTLLSIDD